MDFIRVLWKFLSSGLLDPRNVILHPAGFHKLKNSYFTLCVLYLQKIRGGHRYFFHNPLYAVPLFFCIPLNAKTFGIRDQGKPYSGSWLQGSKRHWIPDPRVRIRNTGEINLVAGSSPSPFTIQVHVPFHKNQLFEIVRGMGWPLCPHDVRPAKLSSLSTAAEEGRGVLYLLKMESLSLLLRRRGNWS